jgi:hypothetical protein
VRRDRLEELIPAHRQFGRRQRDLPDHPAAGANRFAGTRRAS